MAKRPTIKRVVGLPTFIDINYNRCEKLCYLFEVQPVFLSLLFSFGGTGREDGPIKITIG